MERIEELNNQLKSKDTFEVIQYFSETFGKKAAFSTSLSIEDQVITHMLSSINSKVKIFTLDTGRLPNETYSLIERTREQYNIKIHIYFPNYRSVEKMVREKGINLFYNSIEDRKRCCYVRKIEPLKRALKNIEVWITGLRREQSITRQNIELIEYDYNYKLIKVNPLFNWTEAQVWDYIKKNNIPYNSLYDKNYLSIGCAPCTRPVQPGEDIRAGRWWWENPNTKECGLHIKQ
ncbi:MAG: phosphoadenylyl-sulfate reductase [Melioribacter sp.]|uniref:phosphoadenylyl-sulfate reductase n=1 Tax=Rosettibacter primus TaxID=3111523 RepID=UPI00247D1CB4|nr:phosphoadenylyl-sulfate reductase [Melioribacter sp.]